MANGAVARNESELAVIRNIAGSEQDSPLLMLNMNRYTASAGFPYGGTYREYMSALETLLPQVGGKILWRVPVLGQAVGEQALHEVLAVWYPSHRAFLEMPDAPGAKENYALREQCVEYAVIHRCPGETAPFDGT
jgi:hypothetical protein